ncbi:MAG: ABC transporter ATP-binding protein [Lactobacillaceae bacterium]|jgi:ABC-2 type transport system ATP-binding protein|nr:ABC transporter ATP-binding protein [Lactobacillaceae bacterium]
MITVRNIYKSFGEIKALNDVSFDAGIGVLALLGVNGAGKTTLIRVITGYLVPNDGEVSIEGLGIDDNRIEALRNIGYVPENNPIYQDLTSFEMIKLNADLWNIGKKDFAENLNELVNRLDIKTVINQKISTLSKGYKRRVAIAASLIHKPKILILDEPTDGLDPNQKFVVRKFIKEYSKDNIVIVSTHIMEDVEAIADRVMILDKGKIILDAAPDELKKKAPDNDMISAFYKITNSNKE